MDYAAQGNYPAQSAAQMQKLQGAPATRDNVQSVSQDIGRQVERLAKLAEHLRMMADRIEGSRPEPVSSPGNDNAAIPHSLIADMRSKNTALSSLVGTCEDQAMRLTSALGIQL